MIPMKQQVWVVMLVLVLNYLVMPSDALYFYLDTSRTRCFVEEMPKDTMVVGKYRAEQHIPQSDSYRENPQLSLEIIVEQLPQKKVIKHQKGASSGEFSFTAGQSGSYSICLSTSDKGGWFSHDKARVYLDIVLGDSAMEINGVNGGSSHDEKLSEMAMRVRDLNHRIADIRREQSFQRVREAEFRDRSESTNAKAVWWTIVQMFMLGLTALWQVRHLKGFFEKKKLV